MLGYYHPSARGRTRTYAAATTGPRDVKRCPWNEAPFSRGPVIASSETGPQFLDWIERREPKLSLNSLDDKRINCDRLVRFVLPVPRGACNFLYDVVAFDHLAEDGVFSCQPLGCRNSDEEL
jgi:hypothetical protein